MSYLRRNIRDLTSKLIAANGGELSEEMKQALLVFANCARLYQQADKEDRRHKSQTKRQRRRFARREADQDRRKRQEEWIEWLNFQAHEENDRYGEYEYAGIFFTGTNALEWMDDESLEQWEEYLAGQSEEEPQDIYYDVSWDGMWLDSPSCMDSHYWWHAGKGFNFCPDCGQYIGR